MAFRRYRTLATWLGSSAIALMASLITVPASAQTVIIQNTGIKRVVGLRDSANKPYWVSHSDCVADDVFTFPVDMTSFSGKSLQVWAGPECTTKTKREGSQIDCWKLYEAFPQTTTLSVKLRAQDMVAQEKPGAPGTGTSAACERTDIATEGVAVVLHFMLLDSNNDLAGTEATFDSGFDVIGPPAPTSISAGIGEKQLIVSWTNPIATDLAGYRVYCDSGNGPGSAPAAGGAAGSSGAAGAGATDAGSDAAAEASATGGDSGLEASAGGSGGTSGSSGTGGSGGGSAGNPDCPSASLTPGTIPSSEYQCGSTSSKVSTEVTATNLANGVKYAVAVAAFDTLGNSGPLSKVACGTPQPVDDFFELYRRAGGKGGGGFCALGQNPSQATLALFGAALAVSLLRRRRRLG